MSKPPKTYILHFDSSDLSITIETKLDEHLTEQAILIAGKPLNRFPAASI